MKDEKNDYPHYKGKAYDAKLLCMYLAQKFRNLDGFDMEVVEYLSATKIIMSKR